MLSGADNWFGWIVCQGVRIQKKLRRMVRDGRKEEEKDGKERGGGEEFGVEVEKHIK